MINVEGLTKYYDDVKAVAGVSFSIDRGEIVGILGPNGAGKSTTLRMLTCYLTPTAGQASVGDMSVYDNPISVKKMIGYLPESAPLYPDMVVYDYLVYAAEVQEVPKENIEERIRFVVEKCGLKGVVHKMVRELSKGYRQRVGLAHAIIHDPEILILDEPTSGLDPNQIVEIRALIKELGKEKTVILSTHILSEVEASCDRVIIISSGEIVADNSTEALVQKKGASSVVELKLKGVHDKAILEQTLKEIENVESVHISDELGLVKARISAKADVEIRESVYHAVRDTEWIIYEMVKETQSLEDIFQELTKEAK